MIHPQIRTNVPDGDVGQTPNLNSLVKEVHSHSNADIAQQNPLSITALVQRAARVEMIDTTEPSIPLSNSTTLRLALVAGVSGNVVDKVQRPSQKLLTDKVHQGCNRSLLGQLNDVMANATGVAARVLLTRLGNKNHVTLKMSGCLMVLSVGNLP